MKLPNVTLPCRNNKHRPAAAPTAGVYTLEDLFTIISESKREIKETRKSGVEVVFDVDSDGSADADADARGDTDMNSIGGIPEAQNDNLDIDSISSWSTMATMDDNPGAGRIMVKYIYQPAERFIEKVTMYIAFLLHVNRGGPARTPFLVPDSDCASLLSLSSTSTATDLPGTGRIIDKYVYRKFLGLIERCGGRFTMSYCLSALEIYRRIEELWHNVEIKEPCFVCRHPHVDSMSTAEKVRMAMKRIEDAPSGMFILSGMAEIIKRMRSRFLLRRVEARIACVNLFDLDALHVLQDAGGVKHVLLDNHKEDEKKLFHRLSARAEKKRRAGNVLPPRQKVLLNILRPKFDDRLFSSGKPRMGTDLLLLLEELIPKTGDVLTDVEAADCFSLAEEMLTQCLDHLDPYLAPDVPCRRLTEVLESLYLVVAFHSILRALPSRRNNKSREKCRFLFAVIWPRVMRIVDLVTRSYAVPECEECGPRSSVRECLCLDRIVAVWRIIYLFTNDERCTYENVLRDANNLCENLFSKCFGILLDTSEQASVPEDQLMNAVLQLYAAIALGCETHTRDFVELRRAVEDALENKTSEHGTRFEDVVKGCDLWDEKLLQQLKENKRRRHAHVVISDIASLISKAKAERKGRCDEGACVTRVESEPSFAGSNAFL